MSRPLVIRARCAALALVAAAPAFAQEPAQSHRLHAAWEAAINEEGGYLAPAARARLMLVAYHAAAARLCDGFAVDEAKIAAVGDAAVAEALSGLEGEALAARHADILIDLGTSHGLFLAEGSLHPEKFCAKAAEARAEPGFENLWR